MSRWPIRDYNHRTTTDMWLYRAYSGSLYHGGELGRALPSFTQGDTITCILDMEARTISFAKNNKVTPRPGLGIVTSTLRCVIWVDLTLTPHRGNMNFSIVNVAVFGF